MKKFKYDGMFSTSNIFECTCHDFNHTFKVEVMRNGKDEKNEEFAIEVSLDESVSIFKRIAIAFKYIFTGRSSIWDRIMKRDDMIRLMKQLEVHFGAKPNRSIRK